MASKAWKRRIAIQAAVLGVLGLAYGALVWTHPIEVQEFWTRLQMRRKGIEPKQIDGLSAWVRDLCQGRTPCRCVGMIHGSGDTALTWRRVMEGEGVPGQDEWKAAKIPAKLVAVDLPGSGASPAPLSADGYNVKALAKRVAQSLLSVCPQWTLVGNSFGGWVAAEVALSHPEAIVHLVLISSAGLKTPTREPLGLFDNSNPTLEDLKEFQKRAYFKPRPLPDAVWAAAYERFRSGHSDIQRSAQTDADYLDERLPGVRAATLILWGEADRILPMTWGEYFKARIPMSTLHKIDACGHMPQKECPGIVIRELQAVERFGTI